MSRRYAVLFSLSAQVDRKIKQKMNAIPAITVIKSRNIVKCGPGPVVCAWLATAARMIGSVDWLLFHKGYWRTRLLPITYRLNVVVHAMCTCMYTPTYTYIHRHTWCTYACRRTDVVLLNVDTVAKLTHKYCILLEYLFPLPLLQEASTIIYLAPALIFNRHLP